MGANLCIQLKVLKFSPAVWADIIEVTATTADLDFAIGDREGTSALFGRFPSCERLAVKKKLSFVLGTTFKDATTRCDKAGGEKRTEC